MPFVTIVSLAIQIYFAVHAARTGRHRWIFIILIFPYIGALVYFFVEMLPELQYTAKAKRARNPGHNLRQLKRSFELADTVYNRVSLAEAYYQNGQYQEAINLLEPCLDSHANDSHILEGLCYSYYKAGNFEKALGCLTALEENAKDKLPDNLKLFRALTYEALGNNGKALEDYEAIIKTFSGEEARCRYALLLKKNGEAEKAREIFEEIVKNVRLGPRHYQKAQKQWVNIAVKEL